MNQPALPPMPADRGAGSGSRKLVFGRYDYASFSTYATYASASIVVPVALVALAADLGFDLEAGGMAAGGALHLGRTVAIVISMLLCGFVAGKWGKRRTLGLSVMLMAAGVLLCAVAPVYSVLFIALMIAGLGEGGIEAIATPFVQALHPKEPGRYINFAHAFWPVGITLTVLAAGALLSMGVSWRLVIGVCGLLGLLAAAMILLPERKGQHFPEHPEPIHWRAICEQSLAIFKNRRFWLFFAAMFAVGGGEFCLTFWIASFIQLSFVDSAWLAGVGTALYAGGMFLGRSAAGYWLQQHHLQPLVFWAALVATGLSLCIPFTHQLWVLLVLLFLSGIATAPFWPSIQSHGAERLPELDTTMVFIYLSCAGVPGCGVLTWTMGIIGDWTGDLRIAFFLAPLCFAVIAILIGWDWLVTDRRAGPARQA